MSLALVSVPSSASAACSVSNAVAKIAQLEADREGDVRITRSGDQRSINARLNHYLCDGDRLIRTNAASVSLKWDGRATIEPISTPTFLIKALQGWSIVGWAQDKFTLLFGNTGDSAPPVRTVSASGRGWSAGEDQTRSQIEEFSHGYGAKQAILASREVLSVSWKGSVLRVRLIAEDGRVLSSTTPYGQSWTAIAMPLDVQVAMLVFEEPNGRTREVQVNRSDWPAERENGGNGERLFGSIPWAAENAFGGSPLWKLEGESVLQAARSTSLIAEDLWNRVGSSQ